MQMRGPITKAVDSIAEKMAGKVLSATHQKHLQAALKKFGIKVSVETNRNVNPNMVVINGAHYQWLTRQNIEIFLVYNQKSKRCLITEDIWNKLRFDVIQAAVHETIHRQQHEKAIQNNVDWESHHYKIYRSKNPLPSHKEREEYYGSTVEIYAMSHCILMELQTFYKRGSVLDALKNAKNVRRDESHTLYSYLDTFGNRTDHPVMKRLFKNILSWKEKYDEIEEEQAYQNAWIIDNRCARPEPGESVFLD